MPGENTDNAAESTTEREDPSGEAGRGTALAILEEEPKEDLEGPPDSGLVSELLYGMGNRMGEAQHVPAEGPDNLSRRTKRILKGAMPLFLGNEHTKRADKFYSKFKENIYLITEDSETIGAFLYAPESVDADTQFFVVCHGKGCDRYQVNCFIDFAALSAEHNTCILLLDYRGFADSSGEYTIQGVNYDILAAFRYLSEARGAREVSLVGHSLGSAVVLEYSRFALAVQKEFVPKRVFAISPFTTTLNICREFTMYSIISFFIPDIERVVAESFNYDNLENARLVSDRLVIFHGSKDPIISADHGKRIAEATGCPIFITAHNHVNIFADTRMWRSIFRLNAE